MFAAVTTTAFTRDAALMHSFRDMVLRGAVRPGIEVAAFVVLNSDGSYACRLWPATQMREKQVFVGEIPANVVAIVHTHPENTSPWPSEGDISEAHRLRIAIWVLTRYAIYSVDADGHRQSIFRNTNWVAATFGKR